MPRAPHRFTTAKDDTRLADSLYATVSSELELEQRYELKRLSIRLTRRAPWSTRCGIGARGATGNWRPN